MKLVKRIERLEDLLEWRRQSEIGKLERSVVRANLNGNYGHVELTPGVCCGKARSGVTIDMVLTKNGTIGPCRDGTWHTGGTVTLDDARRIRDMLSKFIVENEQ